MKSIEKYDNKKLKLYEQLAESKIQECVNALDFLKKKNEDNSIIAKRSNSLALNILLFVFIVLYAVLIPNLVSFFDINIAIGIISLYCNCICFLMLLVNHILKYVNYYKMIMHDRRIVNCLLIQESFLLICI